jgi:hypothetical protein
MMPVPIGADGDEGGIEEGGVGIVDRGEGRRAERILHADGASGAEDETSIGTMRVGEGEGVERTWD